MCLLRDFKHSMYCHYIVVKSTIYWYLYKFYIHSSLPWESQPGQTFPRLTPLKHILPAVLTAPIRTKANEVRPVSYVTFSMQVVLHWLDVTEIRCLKRILAIDTLTGYMLNFTTWTRPGKRRVCKPAQGIIMVLRHFQFLFEHWSSEVRFLYNVRGRLTVIFPLHETRLPEVN